MKWEIVGGYEELSARAAEIFLAQIEAETSPVVGLPTGRTPQGMYKRIVGECRRKSRCFGEVVTFNLDEYAGIPPEHPGSYCSYMRRNLFDHVDIQPRNANLPDGTARAVRAELPQLTLEEALALECSRYEERIAAAGGLLLTFLGLGRNGHIAFNEPGAPFDSRTRVVELAAGTRAANAPEFAPKSVPERAITMGIATILSSRTIVVLASGHSKAEVLRRLRDEPPTVSLPASALQGHPDVLVLADRAAAGAL